MPREQDFLQHFLGEGCGEDLKSSCGSHSHDYSGSGFGLKTAIEIGVGKL